MPSLCVFFLLLERQAADIQIFSTFSLSSFYQKMYLNANVFTLFKDGFCAYNETYKYVASAVRAKLAMEVYLTILFLKEVCL